MKKTVFTAFTFLAICVCAFGAKKGSSLEYLVTPKMSQVSFSPEGGKIAALVRPAYANASVGIWSLKALEPSLVKVVDREGGGGPKRARKVQWLDEKSAVILSDWRSGTDAISIWREGKKNVSTVLSSSRYDLVDTNENSSEIVVTEFPSWGRFGECRVLKLKNGGKKKEILYECESAVFEAYCDQESELRLIKRHRTKGGPVVWFAKPKGAEDWRELKLSSSAKIYGFDYDSDTLWVGGYFEQKSPPGIYRYSLGKDELLGLVSKNGKVALSDCATPQFSGELQQVVGLHVDLVKPRSQWSHTIFKKLQERIDAIFKDSGNRILAWSPDFGRLVIERSFPDVPTQTTFIDLMNPKVRVLFVNGKRVERSGAAYREVIRVSASGERKVSCVLARRKDAKGKTPLVVLLRPDPWGSLDTASWSAEGQFLAAEGYAVLRVNFKGSGPLLGKDWVGWKTEADVRSSIQDLDTVVDWIQTNREEVDTSKIAVLGTGASGWLASYAACERPERYKAVVSNMGIYDLSEYRKAGSIKKLGEIPFAKTKRFDDATLLSFSPVENMDSMEASLFVAYSEKNGDEYLSQVNRFLKSAKKAGVKVHKPFVGTWWGSSIANDSQLQAYYAEVSRFLKKAL
ncbi:alpha/beta hydrolase family protein [Pelagicoccus mobilis]|uniref:Prolyl oligopeptidase family serine peptidase n=1 Tax=Pelagicoccus mobilis TaxID=415221 RepID=A0A934VL11_9BACT|nr:prolyl oligopeptidase family serine peptidase [Pelagicoccus mobilis]MBK1877266.1 prolyl oligopeptidase family serine peptidase [Pelagicoccus mobilis]